MKKGELFLIREPELHELQAFYVEYSGNFHELFELKTRIFYSRAAFLGRRPIAAAGLQRAGGRLWAFFDILPGACRQAAFLVVEMRHGLRKLGQGHPIYIQQDETFGTSDKLIEILNFEPTGETYQDMKVYQWQG